MEKTIRALLIEDNPAEVRLIRELLSELPGTNLELEEADLLAAGLDRLGLGGVDVVLLDLSLPDSYGLETLLQIRARASKVPVVVLTGSDEESLALQAVQKGAQDYLIKGQADGRLILRAIRYAIERARTLAALRESQQFIQQVADFVYMYDAETLDIVHANQSFANLVGLSLESLRMGGKSPWSGIMEATPYSELEGRAAEFRRLPDGDVLHCDFQVKTASGGSLRLRSRESVCTRSSERMPELIVGTAYPMPDEGEPRAGLERDLLLMRAALDQVPYPVFVKDAQGRFSYCNGLYRELIGVSSLADVLGKTTPGPAMEAAHARPGVKRKAPPSRASGLQGDVAAESPAFTAPAAKQTAVSDESGEIIGWVGTAESASPDRRD